MQHDKHDMFQASTDHMPYFDTCCDSTLYPYQMQLLYLVGNKQQDQEGPCKSAMLMLTLARGSARKYVTIASGFLFLG